MNAAPGMDRARSLESLRSRKLDVVIVGGGITGAGVALDAASRGLSVALVEKDDFGSGTSSRSSKLIHGGLRYLKQFQFGVTIESIREREILLTLAPHLVEPLRFLLPYHQGVSSRLMYGMALTTYDFIAGHPQGRRHSRINRQELRRRAPFLGDDSVAGAFEYFDAHTDDCRLVMHVIRKAAELGATVANYVEVEAFRKNSNGVVEGIEGVDRLSGDRFGVECGVVVNATGVWSDTLRRRLDPALREMLRPSKGIHLVLGSEKLRISQGVTIPRTSRGQGLFVVPWEGRVVVGTTDTPFEGRLDHPRALREEIDFLLSGVQEWFPGARIEKGDILSTFAGLRPLLNSGRNAKTSKIPRDAGIETEQGMITVTGGKLTTYRAMSERVVDLLTTSKCRTRSLKLFPSDSPPRAHDSEMAAHLHRAYGSEAAGIAGSDGAGSRIDPEIPYSVAEIDYAIRSEMAMTISDVLVRRLRLALTARDSQHGAELVADRFVAHHGWSPAERVAAMNRYRTEITEFAADPVEISESAGEEC